MICALHSAWIRKHWTKFRENIAVCKALVMYTIKKVRKKKKFQGHCLFQVAVCNLASIAVNQFVDAQKKIFDFNRLKEVTKVVTKNLNKIINVNYYPVPEARKSNMRHRPIGIGVSNKYIVRGFDYSEFHWGM